MGKKRSHAGFTLAELLIVVAIVAVLVSIAIPVFAGGRERASAAQCLANRTMIEHAIKVEQMLSDDFEGANKDIVKKILEAAAGDGGGYFAGSCVCSEGGAYSYNNSTGKIECTVKAHNENGGSNGNGGGETPTTPRTPTTVAEETVLLMEDILNMSPKELLEKYGISNFYSNDPYREVLCQQVFGGTWPELPEEIQQETGLKGTFYVQPYVPNRKRDKDNFVLFAGKQSSDKPGWSTNLIAKYDAATKSLTWYEWTQKGSTMLTKYNEEGWSKIQEEIDQPDSPWKKVES